MARVTVEQSQKIARAGKGVKMFSFDIGKLYHVLFLGEKVGEDEQGKPIWAPILYMNPTHQVRGIQGGGFEVRCANKDLNTSNVVKTDKEGNLLVNSLTGRPINDGTCPYCELEKDYSKWVFKEREKFIKENPHATEKEIKDFTRKLFNRAPVSQAQHVRVMLVAIFELGNDGKVVTDRDGNKVYQIQAMRFSEHRFTNKLLEQVEIVKMNLEDENDDGLAWHEYYFKFPKNEHDSKMISGKDMTITPVQFPILDSDEGLRKQLIEEVEELDLDELENNIYIYKLKSLEEMERDISLYRTKIDLSDDVEDIEDVREGFEDDEEITGEDVKNIMGDTITDEDIEKLM